MGPLKRKRASSTDVAKLAGVSQATVSYVLSRRQDKAISTETRAKVLQAAAELGYMPNRLADGVLRGRTSSIGVLMADFGHSFYANLLVGLEDELAREDYHILIGHTQYDAQRGHERVRMLLEHRVEGIVVVADESTIGELPAWAEEVHRAGGSVIVIDDRRMEGELDTVISDDVEGLRRAVAHLVERGHRRIAFLGGGTEATTARDRLSGYRQGMAEHGLEVDERAIVPIPFHTDLLDANAILDLDPRPTAVVAISDAHAARAMRAVADQGLRIPEDMAFIGYGNPEWADFLGLTSVNQDPHELGRLAASQLLRRIRGQSEPSALIKLVPELVVRRSTMGR